MSISEQIAQLELLPRGRKTIMTDYTAEQYREASQGYVGPSSTKSDTAKESVFSQFTTRELEIEIERRKESAKGTFCKLVDDMYSRGFTYEELKEILDNI